MATPHLASVPLNLDELSNLARRFVEAQLFDEAVQLFELALRLDSKNVGVQLNLAQVKRLASKPQTGTSRSMREVVREQLRRNALDAKHFLGLAYLWLDRGDAHRAKEYLEIAIAKDLPNPAPHKLLGKLLYKERQYARAIIQLSASRRFNPFDRQVNTLLGRCRFELGDYEGALAAYIDAFLLIPDDERDEALELRDSIQEVREILDLHNDRLSHLFRQRQDQLNIAFERLEWHRDLYQEEAMAADVEIPEPTGTGGGRLELAGRLRRLEAWSHLTDEQIFRLSGAAHLEEVAKGELIFEEGEPGADLYLLEKGEITIQRTTAYGAFPLGLLKSGDLFGEVNFITRGERSGDALASQGCELLRIDALELDRIIHDHPELGVQVLWSFWHGLAFKLRCTNEQLRTFFSDESMPENFLQLQEHQSQAVEAVVDPEAKKQLFREQGLTGEELMALTAFSREETYPSGAYIFREGELGREMYVVLDGEVRISKYIPGGGEEALAILRRGDFFGEMALIDGHPRSADAKTHRGPAMVIAFEEDTIRDVLAAAPEASLEFLQLLCTLVAKRLREIDEKVIGWRIMAGVGAHQQSA